MPKEDSMDKLIPKYFPAFVASPFTYIDSSGISSLYQPKPARFSLSYFNHGWECVSSCGGCCPAFSLDWAQYEFDLLPDFVRVLCTKRDILINGKKIYLYSIMQNKSKEDKGVQWVQGKAWCRFLDLNPKAQFYLGCRIHKYVVGGPGNPLTCALPLLDFDQNNRHIGIVENMMSGGGARSKNTILPIFQPRTKGVKCKKVSQPNEVEDREKIERLKRFIEYCGLSVWKEKFA